MHCDIPVDDSTWANLKIKAIQANRTCARYIAELIEADVGYVKPLIVDMGSGGKPSIGVAFSNAEAATKPVKVKSPK